MAKDEFYWKKEGKLNMTGLLIDYIDIQFYPLLLQLFSVNNLRSKETSLFIELASMTAQKQMSIQSFSFKLTISQKALPCVEVVIQSWSQVLKNTWYTFISNNFQILLIISSMKLVYIISISKFEILLSLIFLTLKTPLL